MCVRTLRLATHAAPLQIMGSRTVAAGNSRPVWRCAAVALAAIGAAAMLPTSHGAYVYLPVHTHHHLVGAAQKLARLKLGRLQKLPRAPYASTNKYHPRPRRTYTGKAVREPPPPSYDYDYDDYPDYSSAEFGLTPEEAQCTAVEAVQEVEIAGCTDIHARAGACSMSERALILMETCTLLLWLCPRLWLEAKRIPPSIMPVNECVRSVYKNYVVGGRSPEHTAAKGTAGTTCARSVCRNSA